jgi:hypothetical protein
VSDPEFLLGSWERGKLGRWEGGKVGRWEGGKVGRWEGGKVGRWEGGKVGRGQEGGKVGRGQEGGKVVRWVVSCQESGVVLKQVGVQYAPKKIHNLLEVNALLAHQPWLVKEDHIEV